MYLCGTVGAMERPEVGWWSAAVLWNLRCKKFPFPTKEFFFFLTGLVGDKKTNPIFFLNTAVLLLSGRISAANTHQANDFRDISAPVRFFLYIQVSELWMFFWHSGMYCVE